MTSPALSVRGVRRSFGDHVALEGLDLEVMPGEAIALIGANGSGKTTALRVAAGRLEPSDGQVTIRGESVHGTHSYAARAGIAFVPDTPVLYDDLTVREHLQLVALAHDLEDRATEIEKLLELLGLTVRGDSLPGQLSRGMRQKAQISCALVRPFEVLLLDEPLIGLDPRSQATLHTTLQDVKDNGAGIVLSTHQVEFGTGLCDRAVVLAEGRVEDSGPFDEVVKGQAAARLGLR